MREAFRSLPVVSLVCGRDELFGPRGLYLNTMQRGTQWEKACSAEMIVPDGGEGFQIDCGLRIQGGMNRDPHRSLKHSFRLVFKEQYGAGKLHYAMFPDSPVKKFDTLVLRADYNNSWVHWDAAARQRAQRTRDAWMKDSHRAMGWVAAHNRYVHLFLDGLYWGVYDFTEQPDASLRGKSRLGRKQELVCHSPPHARWGDYRRNAPYTHDKEWVAEQQRLLKEYFPRRTEIVLEQLRAAGLYPQNAAPPDKAAH